MNKEKKTEEKSIGSKLVISFYKKRKCWYAEVPQHTEAQNMMVAGADEMCEVLANGHKRVTVTVIGNNDVATSNESLISLEKVSQTKYGATYRMDAKVDLGGKLPAECWLCNVTKTVFGSNHPRYIEIVDAVPNDEEPYSWMAE